MSDLRTHSGEVWHLCCSNSDIHASVVHFLEITDLLLEQVQLNSTHLFRADILYDTAGRLSTLAEKEQKYRPDEPHVDDAADEYREGPLGDVPVFDELKHERTVLRRLIPRKPQLDEALLQSCYIYRGPKNVLVVYTPHCDEDAMPWYHPKVKGLAYSFAPLETRLSVYCLPFSTETPSERLKRTFLSLLNTQVRLLKLPSKKLYGGLLKTSDQDAAVHSTSVSSNEAGGLPEARESDLPMLSLAASSLKDTILPQHIVQDTYSRLKGKYAADLLSRWVEKTEPSKHVFEDISIAAFLVELWNTMYSRPLPPEDDKTSSLGAKVPFPGFVDIACGNGVLTYILLQEGWHGMGFDARTRKTWHMLDIGGHLEEKVCIPQPFLDRYDSATELQDLSIHNGIFPPGAFIISNHADELTCWTPILAALSSPTSPHPFLAIPCCSHALDGSKYRYTLKDVAASSPQGPSQPTEDAADDDRSSTGDLAALRAAKKAAHAHTDANDKSTYACLTRKTAALAQELGTAVELTLMRIPSTRNIGIVGNRKRAVHHDEDLTALGHNGRSETEHYGVHQESRDPTKGRDAMRSRIDRVIERECARRGGIEVSATTWIEKAKKLQGGQGRGKVNWNGPQIRES